MDGIFILCSGSGLTSHGWTTKRKGHTRAVRLLKRKVKELPCLALVNPETFKIVETYTSDDDDGYGEVLVFLGQWYGEVLKERTQYVSIYNWIN